jgi:hypothetical protein
MTLTTFIRAFVADPPLVLKGGYACQIRNSFHRDHLSQVGSFKRRYGRFMQRARLAVLLVTCVSRNLCAIARVARLLLNVFSCSLVAFSRSLVVPVVSSHVWTQAAARLSRVPHDTAERLLKTPCFLFKVQGFCVRVLRLKRSCIVVAPDSTVATCFFKAST